MAFAREISRLSNLSNVFDIAKVSKAGCLQTAVFVISARTGKHWNPKFKWLRSKKNADILLPHTEEAKKKNKRIIQNLGIYPRYWRERPLTVTSAFEIMDPYKPVAGDGKTSLLSSRGLQSLVTAPKSKVADIAAIRRIKNYDPDFKKNIFVQEAQDIYIKAHSLLMKNDPEELSPYVTEKAILEMMNGLKRRTLRWKFIESVEPPVLVQARSQEVLLKVNLFAQVTVRFHTKQSLAIYDRFGRLMYGSEIIPKDVLEYVVFEKHISNEHGRWKLHGKIIPEWQEPVLSNSITYRVEDDIVEDDEEEMFFNEQDPESEVEHTSTSEIQSAETKAIK